MLKRAAAAVIALACAVPATAQSVDEPDLSKARVRIGPLAMSPMIELTNFGYDSNVLDLPNGESKGDYTFTLSPHSDLWLKMGPTWLKGAVREDVVWYQNTASDRAANQSYTAGWLAPLNHLRINLNGTYIRARERVGFEIDTRAQRSEVDGDGTIEVRVLARTFIGVRGSRRQFDYAQDAEFLGTNLHDALNRVVTSGGVTIRHELTPLTSISVIANREQDRFTVSSLRDSDTTELLGQVTFDPSALVHGSARVGYRDFQPHVVGIPGFRGVTTNIDLGYTLLESTRFTFGAQRDVEYSYDANEPYYLLTGVTGSVAQQVYGPMDVVIRGGLQKLAYRDNGLVIPITPAGRADHVRSYGGGFGYHFGQDLRVGVNVDRQRRTSPLAFREYEDLRVGTSVTYGF